jgi:hypothetical protein
MQDPVPLAAQDPRVGDRGSDRQAIEGVTPPDPLLQAPWQVSPTARLAQLAGQVWALGMAGAEGRPAQSVEQHSHRVTHKQPVSKL